MHTGARKRSASRVLAGLASMVSVLSLVLPASGQMVTGLNIPGFKETFGVDPKRKDFPCRAEPVECSAPGNVLWPGDEAKFTFQLINAQNRPFRASGKVEVIAYGTKGRPGNIWVPDMFRIAECGSEPVCAEGPAKGFANVTVAPRIPARFGAYGLVVDLGEGGRQFLTSCVRTFPARPARVQFPRLGMDVSNVDVLRRLNCKSIRRGVHWRRPSDRDFKEWIQREEAELRRYHEANVTLIIEVGGGGPQPWSIWIRSFLNDQNEGPMGYPGDGAWLPSADEEFARFVEMYCTRFGWPRGPVVAFKIWNEPWEGSSISGWGADMLRYREIHAAMARGVEAARERAGVQVLLGGCDSSSNTLDKLFCDGLSGFLKWLDFVSIHYQGMAPPSTVKMWVDRKSPLGRVRIWDTESWVANCDDRVAAVIATNMSTGHDRAAGIYGGNIAEENEHEVFGADGKRKRIRTVDAWSVAASVGAAQHFLEERAFKELLFRNGLPWVMVFDGLPGPDGKPDPEDGTIVVVGDIGDEFGHVCLLFRTARGFSELRQKEELRRQLAALPPAAPAKARQELEEAIDKPQTLRDATLTLADGSGFLRGPRFSLYDFHGNPVPSRRGQIVAPLDHRGFYLRANGGKGSFARLVEAVRTARIEGIEPLATVCHDLLSPVEKGATLKLTLTNVLNRPVKGRLEVKLGALKVEPPSQDLAFRGHETRVVELKVAGAPNPDSIYPLSLTFDAGRDGRAVREEGMHVNVIARRTITVDGNLDDWKDVLPQIIVGTQKTTPTVTEASWFPLRKFDESFRKGFAVGYLAYDAEWFCFAAKIADDTPDPGMPRFETRNDDEHFYPEKCYKIEKDKDGKVTKRTEQVWPEGVRRYTYRKEPELPSGNYPNHDNVQIAFNVLPPEAKGWYSHPPGTMPGYIAYLDTDYEYALNPVAEKYGGGVEIWRLLVPGMPRTHFYPRQPKCPFDGPVKDGKLAVRRDGNTRIVECAPPWTEIPDVKKRLDAGQSIKFSFRVNDNANVGCMELARRRSVSRINYPAFHVDWTQHWANEVEFSWER